MESFQGSFNNPCFLGEHLNVECLEEGDAADFSYGQFLNKESLRFGEPFSNPIIFQDKMPFLQMLEGVESPSLSPLPDPNFHLLPRIQHQKKPWKQPRCLETDARIPPLELESCVSYLSESHSPIKSETKDQQYPHSSSCLETPSSPDNFKDGSVGVSGNSGSSSTRFWKQANAPQFTKPPPVQEKRKRKKRSRPSKNSEEVESQRMTHIAVERNRRKQMNDHLNALRSLMPPSFIQRGDQASIVGGAIDFVKELEQLLQSLQVQKRLRLVEEEGYSPDTPTSTAFNGFFTSPQYTTYSAAAMRQQHQSEFKYPFNGFMEGEVSEFSAENKSAVADIEVTVIQTHVNLKILSRRRPGQLVKAIAALEELYLDILHLNVTSLESSVLYSFNLKIEEGCSLGSADEIAGAVYQIFNFINGN
ncbi:transcription factor bHLH57-like [Magnolia sinica]|uniref:transcription factor bHLH57-like n=1 Tax=Magnolia sinica TaxID=86752 RepID=UPI00265B45D0|nr:transcription factor bHLH57-like [Magnolia sinica]